MKSSMNSRVPDKDFGCTISTAIKSEPYCLQTVDEKKWLEKHVQLYDNKRPIVLKNLVDTYTPAENAL